MANFSKHDFLELEKSEASLSMNFNEPSNDEIVYRLDINQPPGVDSQEQCKNIETRSPQMSAENSLHISCELMMKLEKVALGTYLYVLSWPTMGILRWLQHFDFMDRATDAQLESKSVFY